MPLLQKMDRMVSFRLSNEEYEQMREICDATGARTISDVARMAMEAFVRNGHSRKTNLELSARVEELESHIERLDFRLAELTGAAPQATGGGE